VHIVFPQQISQPTIFKRVDLCWPRPVLWHSKTSATSA
jgi:hypothetical protein